MCVTTGVTIGGRDSWREATYLAHSNQGYPLLLLHHEFRAPINGHFTEAESPLN